MEIFSYTKPQVIYVLENLEILKGGNWPDVISSLIKPQKHKQIIPHAYFENPCAIAGEIEARINKCGDDGDKAKAFYCDGDSYEKISKLSRMPENEVKHRIKRVLNYCKGRQRKIANYNEWVYHRKAEKISAT